MYSAGEVFELDSPEEFAQAVKPIEADYDSYVAGAHRFYNSVNLNTIVQCVIEVAMSRGSFLPRRELRLTI